MKLSKIIYNNNKNTKLSKCKQGTVQTKNNKNNKKCKISTQRK